MLSPKFFVSILLSLLFSFEVVSAPGNNHKVIQLIDQQPNGLHPINGKTSARGIIFNYTQLTLTSLDPRTFYTVPNLIEKIPSPSSNGLQYNFKIKEGIYWDNGEPLTAKDVLFTMKLIFCPLSDNEGYRTIYTSVIDDISINANDPYSFTLKSKGIQSTAAYIFTEVPLMQASHWDPKGVMEGYNFDELYHGSFRIKRELENFIAEIGSESNTFKPERLVGLGAYQVVRWEADSFIELKRKKKWWGEKDTSFFRANYPSKITFLIEKDGRRTKALLHEGKVDVITNLGVGSGREAIQDKEIASQYEIKFIAEFAYTYIGFNMKADSGRLSFFKDKSIRRALALATPCDLMIDSFHHGLSSRRVANVSKFQSYFNDSLAPIPYDLEKSTQLLDELGWVDSDGDGIREKMNGDQMERFSFRLNYFGASSLSKGMAEMIASHYALIGVEVIPVPLDFKEVYEQAYNHTFDAMFGVWGGSSGFSDPRQIWHTESWDSQGSNFVGFGDEKSDALIERINKTLELEERNRLMKQLQRLIYEEQPYVFLYSRVRTVVYKKDLKNIEVYFETPYVWLNTLQ